MLLGKTNKLLCTAKDILLCLAPVSLYSLIRHAFSPPSCSQSYQPTFNLKAFSTQRAFKYDIPSVWRTLLPHLYHPHPYFRSQLKCHLFKEDFCKPSVKKPPQKQTSKVKLISSSFSLFVFKCALISLYSFFLYSCNKHVL